MTEAERNGFTGGCQCGAVRYELRAAQWVTLCHCRMCQKASGQPFMAFVGGADKNLRWTRGTPTCFQSSNVAQRGFCNQCGTPLTYERPNAGTLSVTIGSLDDATLVQPTLQNGIEGKLGWVEALAAIPSQTTEAWKREAGIAAVVSRQCADDKA